MQKQERLLQKQEGFVQGQDWLVRGAGRLFMSKIDIQNFNCYFFAPTLWTGFATSCQKDPDISKETC